jgi:hypothetical protein
MQEKGSFASPEEPREALYPGNRLFSLLDKRKRHPLTEFDWKLECAVVLPEALQT